MPYQKLLAAITCLALAASGISRGPEDAFHQKLGKDQEVLHALHRLTFGPTAADVEAVRRVGVKKWIDQQLHPERISESTELEARLRPLESLALDNQRLVEKYPPPQRIVAYATGRLPMPEDPEQRLLVQRLAERYKTRLEKKGVDTSALVPPAAPVPANADGRREALRNVAPQRVLAQDLQEAKLFRAVYSNRQLQELLTDFWFNHFNVYLDKGADRYLLTSYERDSIRPYVLGKFEDLLRATAESPAMLFYLDNWQSVSPDSARVRRRPAQRARGLNENYARELLELHTLGVDGGYTQKDIQEIARCFTGWTIREPYGGAAFEYNDRVHDKGEKLVLGVKIPAGGSKDDGLQVLDVLAHHPSTARFLSRQLAQRFVADDPPDSLLVAMAATFKKTDGDLREVMRVMLSSREFWSAGAFMKKVKSPFEMVASALRVTGADLRSGLTVAAKLAELGQPLYRKVEPTGYPNTGEDWVNSAALLARMNFALALGRNELRGVRVPPERFSGDSKSVIRSLLFSEGSTQTQAAIADKNDPAVIAGLILGSPEFQRR